MNELEKIAFRLLDYARSLNKESMQKPVKRDKNQGSITLRKDGRYQGAYYVGGVQRYVYSKTYEDCILKLDNAISNKKELEYKTVYSLLESWFKKYKEPYIKESSAESIKLCIKNHIAPKIGNLDYKKLTANIIQDMLNSVEYPRQREISYNILNACLSKAVELGQLKSNPIKSIQKPIAKSKQGKAFTIEEQQRFLTALNGHRMAVLYKAYIFTGARRNELLGLKWRDVDYDSKSIHIAGVKTDSSERSVPLVDELSELLKGMSKTNADDYIFNYKPDYVNREFKKICDSIGLFGFTVHSLRHTYATRCLECGVNEKVLQGWLGHSSITMTMNTYSHVQTEFERKEAIKLVNLSNKKA